MKDGLNRQWWQFLPMIPEAHGDYAYLRLQRVWKDSTRFHALTGGSRGHEFSSQAHETHLTCTLFENFSLFEGLDWLSPLLSAAGMAVPLGGLGNLRWSYEWESWTVADGRRRSRICDVVISYRTGKGERGVVVVECKALGKKLTKKDLDPSYYLSLAPFEVFGSRKCLLYCVDEAVLPSVDVDRPSSTGLISWQALGGLQVAFARRLGLEGAIGRFVAGALQYQYLSHGIMPAELSAPYLSTELSFADVERLDVGDRQKQCERECCLWE